LGCTDSGTTNYLNVDWDTYKSICPYMDCKSRGVRCDTCKYNPHNQVDYYESCELPPAKTTVSVGNHYCECELQEG